MRTRKLLIVGLTIAIGIAVAGLIVADLKSAPTTHVSQPTVSPTSAVSKSTPPVEIHVTAAEHEAQAPPTPPAQLAAKPSSRKPAAQPVPPAGDSSAALTINGYVVQDPLARAALSYVGADPDATEYWVEAIHDPSLPAEERKDLIEDLNEDGLSDPKHPSLQDMPLITDRIQLIEGIAPYETDRVNIDAFMEAYKDLVDMLDGKPVQ